MKALFLCRYTHETQVGFSDFSKESTDYEVPAQVFSLVFARRSLHPSGWL
jgi:hypothetical protein